MIVQVPKVSTSTPNLPRTPASFIINDPSLLNVPKTHPLSSLKPPSSFSNSAPFFKSLVIPKDEDEDSVSLEFKDPSFLSPIAQTPPDAPKPGGFTFLYEEEISESETSSTHNEVPSHPPFDISFDPFNQPQEEEKQANAESEDSVEVNFDFQSDSPTSSISYQSSSESSKPSENNDQRSTEANINISQNETPNQEENTSTE